MCRSAPTDSGFTFAETLLCVFLLAVALLGLMTALTYSVRATREGFERYQAATLAADLLDGLQVRLQQGAADFETSVSQPQTPIAGHPGYAARVEEERLTPTLKKVTVTVLHPDGEQRMSLVVRNHVRP
ncbi:hypothetical protein DYH09_17270 [bacterium CPR1]|nr:hypothetical protein [bacterium CPR1]